VTPDQALLDNGASGTSSTGTWTASTAAPGYYGADYRAATGGTGAGAYEWTPTLASAGIWQVHARWPADVAKGSTATYAVTHAGGSSAVAVDQRLTGGQWRLLGIFDMGGGAGHKASLSDAAMLPPMATETIVDNASAGTTSTGTWSTGTATGGGFYVGSDWRYAASGSGATFTFRAPVASPRLTPGRSPSGRSRPGNRGGRGG
jgi:hypothetical protein